MAKKSIKKIDKEQTSNQVSKLKDTFLDTTIPMKYKGDTVELGENKDLIAYYDAIGKSYILFAPKTGVEYQSSKKPEDLLEKAEAILLPENERPVRKPVTKKKGKALKKETVPRRTKTELRQLKNKLVEDEPLNVKEVLAHAREEVELVPILTMEDQKIPGYMGIQNKKSKEIVSVVSDTYRLLPNSVVLDPILNYLEKNGIKYLIDRLTYITEKQMRVQLTFPHLKIKDDTDEGILLSLFVHNSYNMTAGFHVTAGAIRQSCMNGMVINQTLTNLKVIHKAHKIAEIASSSISKLIAQMSSSKKVLEERIREMINQRASSALLVKLSKTTDGKVFSHLMRTIGMAEEEDSNRDIVRRAKDLDKDQMLAQTEWEIYNILTDYISHYIGQRYRTDYLRRISRVVKL